MPKVALALPVALIGLAVMAAPANATATRAEYVAQVEPICESAQKPTFKAYFAFAKGFRKAGLNGDDPDVSKRIMRISDRLLAVFYLRVSNIYARTTSRITAVPPAAGDEQTVAAWLAGRTRAALLGSQAGRAAKHRKVKRAAHLLDQGIAASQDGAKLVSDYGFKFCALPLGEAQSG